MGPKKSSFNERGLGSDSASLDESSSAEVWDVREAREDEREGFGGGEGIDAENGDAKNACVLLPIEVADGEGEGNGEGPAADETDEDDVKTLRCELTEDGDGLK